MKSSSSSNYLIKVESLYPKLGTVAIQKLRQKEARTFYIALSRIQVSKNG